MNEYVTIETLKNILSEDSPSAADADTLAEYASIASRLIDQRTNRHFYPEIATKSFNIPLDDAGRVKRQLNLGYDLLELDTLTNGDGDTIASSEFMLKPANAYPRYAVKLKPSSNEIWETDGDGESEQVIDLLGTWGFHDDWTNAWENVDSLTGNITASITTVPVNDADGDDAFGFSPRFSRQHLIKINDEFMYIISTDTAAEDLTVRRGVNGSTAASHSSGDDVYVYRPPYAIRQLARRLTLWLWKQRTSSIDVDRPAITSDGVTVMPMALPKDVTALLADLRRTGV